MNTVFLISFYEIHYMFMFKIFYFVELCFKWTICGDTKKTIFVHSHKTLFKKICLLLYKTEFARSPVKTLRLLSVGCFAILRKLLLDLPHSFCLMPLQVRY